MLSGICFGICPTLAKLSFGDGVDGISFAFIRAALSLLILIVISRIRKVTLAITRKDVPGVMIAGLLGSITTILLYTSYSYIPVGIGTTLEYSYPIITCLICVLLFKEKLSVSKVVALILCSTGIVISTDISGSPQIVMGCFLALASGFSYAIFVVYVDRTGLKCMDPFKYSFYMNIAGTLACFIFGLFRGSFRFQLESKMLFFSFIAALLISIVAFPLFQMGLRQTGATSATMLSTIEPVTCIVLGAIILSEFLTFIQIVGCLMVIASTILITATINKHGVGLECISQQPEKPVKPVKDQYLDNKMQQENTRGTIF